MATSTRSGIKIALLEQLRWAMSALEEITTGGGASLQFAKNHIHNAIEITKELDGN
jgi:hypothetical protein